MDLINRFNRIISRLSSINKNISRFKSNWNRKIYRFRSNWNKETSRFRNN